MAVNNTSPIPRTTAERQMAQYIAQRTFQHLARSDLVREQSAQSGDEQPLIYAWPLDERVVLIINPLRVKNIDRLTSHRFEHHLGTILQGRRVVVTNHRGIFVQVAYWPEPHRELVTRPLDLSEQKTPLDVPIGMSERGPLWISLAEMDAVLIGGARRMGKTNLLHGWVSALLQGKEARLILFDGKGGIEFNRYANQSRCQVVADKLAPVLGELFAEMNQRFDIFKDAHASNIADYNRQREAGARLERIVLVIDELAFGLQEPGVEDVLVDVIARGGAVGIHPILATQRPSSGVITPQLKGNLVTRIALPVPSRADSMVILDRVGAERLLQVPGRLLITHRARLVEAQAFDAIKPIAGTSSNGMDGLYARPELPAHPRLSDRELRLVRAALEREGWFRVREIAEATGESRDWVNDVAKRWQVVGWLTAVQRNESGHQLGRRITPTLSGLLARDGPSGQVDQATEAD